MRQQKSVKWVGASLKDLQAMPEEVKDEIGFVLGRVQEGKGHQSIKPLSGFRAVSEIKSDHSSGTFRLVYVADLPAAIYVLHAFKKKPKKGISTKHELDLIRARLKRVQEASDEEGERRYRS